jgi:2-dehydropantoate 2-reductase
MQIFVLGAGAIGSLYGAKLAAGNDVTLIGRPNHVHAIRETGLRIEGTESQTVQIRAATQIEQVGPGALILVTTKVAATGSALEPVAPLIRDDTTLISLQNGLDTDRIVRDAIGERGVVLRGITQFGAIFDRPGVIRYMAKGYTLLAAHERSQRLGAIFNAAGLDCRISSDIRTEVWRKLVFNCVVNSITTILGCEVGEIVDPRLARLKQLVIDECVVVASAEGVKLVFDFASEINAAYAGSRNIVSMRQDLQHGRVTEIDYLNGAIVALGSRHGLKCPVNHGLTCIIKALEGASKNNRGGPRLPPQDLQTKTSSRAGVRAPETTTSSEIIR